MDTFDASGSVESSDPSIGFTVEFELLESVSSGISGIFDRSFDYYKRHVWKLVFVAFIVLVPTAILLSVLESSWLQRLEIRVSGENFEGDVPLLLQYFCALLVVGVPRAGVPGLLSLFAFVVLSVPITQRIARDIFGNDSSPKRRSGRFPTLLLGWMASGLAFGAVLSLLGFSAILLFVLLFASISQTGQTSVEVGVALLFGVVLVPYFVACAVWARSFALTTPMVVLERCGFWAIPSRCHQLLRGVSSPRLGFAVALLPVLLLGLSGLMVLTVDTLCVEMQLPPVARFWIDNLAVLGMNVLIQPYAVVFFALLYFQSRFRREGLDIRIMAQNVGLSAPKEAYPVRSEMAQPLRKVVPILCITILGSLTSQNSLAQKSRGDESAQVRQNLRNILSQSEFQPPSDIQRNPVSWLSSWFHERWEAFWNWFRGLFKMFGSPLVGSTLQWVFIAVFLVAGGWLAYLIVREGFRRKRVAIEQDGTSIPVVEALEQLHSSEEWLKRSKELAGKGEYREAYRAVFLAGLMGLHETGALIYSRFLPNGYYIRRLEQVKATEVRETMRVLVSTFERIWYGGAVATSKDYDSAFARVEGMRTLLERE